MSAADLDQYLGEAELDPMTARTVTDPARMREIVADVARQGHSIVDQELEEGLRAVAVPIRGQGGSVMAAINLSAHASRVSLAAMRAELLPALLETADRIETDLRSQGGS
jgi:IclR family transcriptional regulator, pca regulon regulatory protein